MSSVLDTIGVSCIGHRGGEEAGEMWSLLRLHMLGILPVGVCVFSFL